jgi:hypothetical protein
MAFFLLGKVANRAMKVAAQNQNKSESPESIKGLHFSLISLLVSVPFRRRRFFTTTRSATILAVYISLAGVTQW